MWVPVHGIDMYQPTAARSDTEYRSPPSLTVSFALAALTAGFVVFLSVVATAPAVFGAFVAGVATAAVVTLVHRVHVESRESRGLAESRPQ
jgi:Kef-type K+ transport system membrane component KefB